MHNDRQLSEREQDILKILLQGKSNKQIASELGISNRTVEFHLSNIYIKLGVASRTEAIIKLKEEPLRESTGNSISDKPVVSPVEKNNGSAENGNISISRRTSMKNHYRIVGGLIFGVFLTALIFKVLPKNTEVVANTATPTPALISETSISTPVAPIQVETPIVIPPHTVNGYTAAIESYYVDSSHLIFQVRVTGGDVAFGDEQFYGRISRPDIFDESGDVINSSGGWGPALDPALYHFEFIPVTLLKGDRIKGQFAFDLVDAPNYENILAQFRFNFDLPILVDARFNSKQTLAANGLEILVDSITISPTFTNIYLCFLPPSFADWNISSQSILEIDGRETNPIYSTVLFDSAIGGDRSAGGEPYWVSPIKNGRCVKSGFPIGSTNPSSLSLTIPKLEQSAPDVLLSNQLILDYPGLEPKLAYSTFLEEHGNTYKGVWAFHINLIP